MRRSPDRRERCGTRRVAAVVERPGTYAAMVVRRSRPGGGGGDRLSDFPRVALAARVSHVGHPSGVPETTHEATSLLRAYMAGIVVPTAMLIVLHDLCVKQVLFRGVEPVCHSSPRRPARPRHRVPDGGRAEPVGRVEHAVPSRSDRGSAGLSECTARCCRCCSCRSASPSPARSTCSS